MSSQQQPGKQFQVRKTQVMKASPILNPSLQQEQRKIGLQPLQFFQHDHTQKVEKEQFETYIINISTSQAPSNQEKRFPNFHNLKGDSQYLAQMQNNKDSIFVNKTSENQYQLQQSNQQLQQLNAQLQFKYRKLEEKTRSLLKIIEEKDKLAYETSLEREEQQSKFQILLEKCLRQKLKKQSLKDKIYSLEQEIISLEASNQVDEQEQLVEGQQDPDQQQDEENLEDNQPNLVLSHSQLYQMIEYLQSRAQQQQWHQENLQNYQQEDVDTDNMTYEQLLELEEEIGNVSRGLTIKQIKKIPKYEVSNLQEMPDRCTVCLNDFKESDKFRELGCKHRYHSKCIKVWLKNEKKCPMCKCEVIIEATEDELDEEDLVAHKEEDEQLDQQ